MDKLLSSKEIAEYLNLQPVTVRRKAAAWGGYVTASYS